MIQYLKYRQEVYVFSYLTREKANHGYLLNILKNIYFNYVQIWDYNYSNECVGLKIIYFINYIMWTHIYNTNTILYRKWKYSILIVQNEECCVE